MEAPRKEARKARPVRGLVFRDPMLQAPERRAK